MKSSLKLLIAFSLIIAGLFAATPTLASSTNTGSYTYSTDVVETQAVPADRIYIDDLYKAGTVLDKYFVYSNQGGYQYRGYLTFKTTNYGGASYSGWLYRAPLPYPEY